MDLYHSHCVEELWLTLLYHSVLLHAVESNSPKRMKSQEISVSKALKSNWLLTRHPHPHTPKPIHTHDIESSQEQHMKMKRKAKVHL